MKFSENFTVYTPDEWGCTSDGHLKVLFGAVNSPGRYDIEFNWEAGIAHSVYKGVPKDIDITAGMLDRLTADIAAIHELRNNRKPTSYEITHRNSIRLYEFTQQGEETVSVPAGKFRTVKYLRQRPGSSRATLIWFAPDADYLPVKIVQLKRGKSQIVMVATLLEPAPVCADCARL